MNKQPKTISPIIKAQIAGNNCCDNNRFACCLIFKKNKKDIQDMEDFQLEEKQEEKDERDDEEHKEEAKHQYE